jgi:hypothetical protein
MMEARWKLRIKGVGFSTRCWEVRQLRGSESEREIRLMKKSTSKAVKKTADGC